MTETKHMNKLPNYNKKQIMIKFCKILKQVSKVCATS